MMKVWSVKSTPDPNSVTIGERNFGGIVFKVGNIDKSDSGLVKSASGLVVTESNYFNYGTDKWSFNDARRPIKENVTINDFSDWRLPTKVELKLMYDNFHQEGLLGNFNKDFYWSDSKYFSRDFSGQSPLRTAWAVNFADGKLLHKKEGNLYYVRFVRSFEVEF